MRCDEFAEHLTAYSLGELRGADEARARAHATACRACAAVLLGERQLVQALRRAAAPAPPRVRERVHAVLGEGREGREGRVGRARRGAAWLTVTGLVLAVVAAGLLAPSITGLVGSMRAPAPTTAPAEPFTAALAAFEPARLPVGPGGTGARLLAVAPGRTELLIPLELYMTEEGVLRQQGWEAAAIDYRGRAGRLAVFRWRAHRAGPPTTHPPTAVEARQTRWGRTYLCWWSDGAVVSMVVGAVRPALFRAAVDRIHRAERRAAGTAATGGGPSTAP